MKMYAVSFLTFRKPSTLTTIGFYYRTYTDKDSGVFLPYGSKAILKIEHRLFFLRNCISCVHNCEDHSSFDFISAVLIWFISYTSITFISFTGTFEHIIDQVPTSVASWLKWLDHRTGIAKLGVQISLSPNLLFRLITQLHSLRSQLLGSFFIWFENTLCLNLKNVKWNPLSNVMYLKFLLLAYFWFWYYN